MKWREKGGVKKQDGQDSERSHQELLALYLIIESVSQLKISPLSMASWVVIVKKVKDWVLFWFTGWLLKTDTVIYFSLGSLYKFQLL